MKALLALTLFAVNMQTASAGGLESFCRSEKTQTGCLTSFLTYKCANYLGVTKSVQCAKNVSLMVKTMDLGVSPKEDGSDVQEEVIFKADLEKQIQSAETTKFLKTIKTNLERKVDSGESFLLWDEVMALSSNKSELAIERLAVLFQDASEDPRHIAYLKKKKLGGLSRQNILLLDEILSYFSLEALKQLSNVKVYPMEFNGLFNNTFYHFYTMAYLSKQLVDEKMDDHLAFFLPFIFNTQYEFKGLDGWPLKDPKQKLSNFKLKEIYAGYMGALVGTKQSSDAQSLKDFSGSINAGAYNFIKKQAKKK